MACDSSGNVFVTGYTSGSGGTLDAGSSAGLDDLFVVKFDSSGDVAWKKQFGSTGTETAELIVLDGQGNIFVAGYTDGALDGQTNSGNTDMFLLKYDTNGNRLDVNNVPY